VIGEFEIGGVFVPALIVWAIVALILRAIVTRILTATGFYRLVWHRGLFDLAILIILWAAVAAALGSRSGHR
jgi:hypothetical protein